MTTVQLHDFRKSAALPASLRSALAGWSQQVCVQASRYWGTQLPFQVEMNPAGVSMVSAGQLLNILPGGLMHFRSIHNKDTPTVLAITRPLMVAVINGMMGNQFDAANLDQALTPIEEELVEFVAERFFLAPLMQVWPFPENLRLAAPTREDSTGDPVYPPSAMLILVQFRVRGSFGAFDWWWMLPRGVVMGKEEVQPQTKVSREERESSVRQLPVQMTVRLGSTNLTLMHLGSIQVGDLLILDQAIDEPLSAILGGQVKFLVRPGASGLRQAISIQESVSSKP